MRDVIARADRVARLQIEADLIRRDVVDMLTAAGHEHRGHPGASLSIVEIVAALYFDALRIDPARPTWQDRDRFVLSKGHGCPAVYAALARRGFFDRGHLRTFRSIDSLLQGHPSMSTPGIDMTSGSLGHGVSAAVGMALDARMRRSPAHVYTLLGDGELQEGLVWEGAMSAAKYELGTLTAIVDCNGLQSSGAVRQIMPLDPLAAKWRAFGWQVIDIDGHDLAAITVALDGARGSQRPTVILARTVKGKGVPYMEGDNRWHQACPVVVAQAAAPPRSGHRVASTRAAFADEVLALARERDDLVVVTADSCGSMGLDEFARRYPERHVEVGIAEQNLVTVAAGLAASGRTVIVATYATFASMRALEQLRTFVAYPNLRVVIVAALAGLSGSLEGVAHLALEDVGILRTVPGLTILNPADAVETRALVRAAASHAGPVYIRLGRDESAVLFAEEWTCGIGAAQVLRRGKAARADAVLLTTGLATAVTLEAVEHLSARGLHCDVVEFPTLKPMDHAAILSARARSSVVITIEEHSLVGGLGTAVMECLSETAPTMVHRIGLPDQFHGSGSPTELRERFGLTGAAVAARVRSLIDAALPAQDDERA